MKHKSKYWKYDLNLYQCECNRTFSNSQSLNAHFGHCNIHRKAIGKEEIIRNWWIKKGQMNGWKNKTPEEIKSYHNKAGKTLSENIKSGLILPAFKGKHHSEESKGKTRKTILKNIETQYGNVRCNYSKRACLYIDNLNKKYNWSLQHALNGGEVRIGNYWVDGYDKENKIIFEYDESKHYINKKYNILTEKDKQRQNNILNILGSDWTMYRYNENLNLLYKI